MAKFVLLLVIALAGVSFAQDRTLPEEDWYGDVKRGLQSHYTGKTVRVKLPIPATRRGLEIVDGTLLNSSTPDAPPPLVQADDELVIKSFRVTDHEIEILLSAKPEKEAAAAKKGFSSLFSSPKQPRIGMRFGRELTSKDLTIENINRLLAIVFDVSTLAAPVAEKGASATQASVAAPQAEEQLNEEKLPTPSIVGSIPSLSPSVGEVTVECSARQARVYIDGSYSGTAPRTIRMRAGVHTIMVVSEGYAPWEQKLFIPGAKASVVRVDMQQAMK